MKIFFIGFNKTGTTTYYNLFKDTHKSIHNCKWAFVSKWDNNDMIKKYLSRADVYCDGECSDFKKLNNLYPNSKFILNTRPIKVWIYSRIKHIYRDYPKIQTGILSREWNRENDKEKIIKKWIVKRMNYHNQVKKYFENKNNLLILNLYDEKLLEKINNFCGTEFNKLPNENTREEIKYETKEYWYKIIDKVLNELNIDKNCC